MNKEDYKKLYDCMQEPINGSNLRTTFLLLTRAHYADSKNFGYLEEQMKCFTWNSNPALSNLEIEPSFQFDINREKHKPGIYVGVDHPTSFSKIDLASKVGNIPDNSGDFKGFLAKTSVNFIHTFESPEQALLAADCTTAFFIGVKDAIRERLSLSSFDPISISPPALIEKEPNKFFRVDVLFALAFNYSVLVNIESHRLKKFAIEFDPEAS